VLKKGGDLKWCDLKPPWFLLAPLTKNPGYASDFAQPKIN
jgi:hypothetical protein